MVKENFSFGQYVASEGALSNTYTGLLGQLLPPLKKSALAGKPLAYDEDKPPPEKPKEPEKPKVKTATVSAKNASLRAGPGSRNQRMRRLSRKTKVEVLDNNLSINMVIDPDLVVSILDD